MTSEESLQPMRKKNRKNKQDRHEERMQRGNEQLAADNRKKQFDNDWKLDWFTPLGKQEDIVNAILSKDEFDEEDNQISFEKVFCCIQGSSGVGTKYIIMGDSKQNYSISKRKDGFKDFVDQVTCEIDGEIVSKSEIVSYTRLTSDENQRSEGSKFITKLYEDNEILR